MLKFSTYEQAFDELLENEGLKKKAAKSGISYGTLKKVYNRGMAAWRTGHRPGTTPQQWGMARVNSYIGKGKGTYYGADSDLSGKGKKKKKESVGEALDKKDVKTVKGVIKGLKKAVATHSSQVKTLTKDIKDSTQVKEISKRTAANYISKASRDTYHLGQRQGKADAIDRIGGTHPDQKYKSGPERKAVKRVVGIDRAARRLATGKGYYAQKEDNAALQKKLDKLYGPKKGTKKEADDYHYSTGERIKKKPVKKEGMSDAEKAAHQKAIDAFKAKGGKIKKLKPGYAQGYHGKSDPAAGMKGMMDKGDTKAFGTRKKVGSMK
tara:strand:+ start:1863 stop:2831 length:969 start_codon:yes stop_codon:yes gene_type:complete